MTVVAACVTIAALLTAALLIAEAQLDDVLARWRNDEAVWHAPRVTPEPPRLRIVRGLYDWEARGL